MRQPPPTQFDDALFLDFDGTLIELAEKPGLVQVPASLPALLCGVAAALGEALAIVSGRSLASIDALLAPMRFCGAGLHGAELRTYPREAPPPHAAEWEHLVLRLRQQLDGDDAIWVEDKGRTLALHYRGAPERADQAGRLLREAVAGTGLEVIAGKCVYEARPPGRNKGYAVRALMRQAAFAGRRPVYVGDDVTDEDGIAAAQDLGGVGVKVGSGASAAVCRLESPAAVRAWLAAAQTAAAPRLETNY
jgi:trehalose 6-phosphate phosphatase